MNEDEMRDLLRMLSGDDLASWLLLVTEEMQRRRWAARLRGTSQLQLVKE